MFFCILFLTQAFTVATYALPLGLETSSKMGQEVLDQTGSGRAEPALKVPPQEIPVTKEVLPSSEPDVKQEFSNKMSIPVQSQGRVKPFGTFARETLHFVHGQSQFQKTPAEDVLFSWWLFVDIWNKTEFLPIPDFRLKKALNLDVKKKLFSPEEILNNPHFIREIEELNSLRASKAPLNDYFKSVQKLESRLILYQAFQSGKVPGWIPSDVQGHKPWRSWVHFNSEEKQLFQNIVSGNEHKSPQQAVLDFQQMVSHKYPSYKKHFHKISIELHYNWLNPFRLAWILYLLGLFLFLGTLLWLSYTSIEREQASSEQKDSAYKMAFYSALTFCVLAFLIQGYGMVLRSYIMARPPVTNMYETVIWVPWVTVILGAILWRTQKMFSVFVCAVAVACFCLLLADGAPELLDGSLHPLEAVLRSSFWLIVHVLTITMSYGAFFLAFALGNVALFLFLRQKNRIAGSRIKKYIRCVDRSLQVGVVLLTAGTILGGIWADYSWGRFWGWDPKETWALISLLAYLALLHSRLMGYIKEFGMAIGSVLLFFFIVMAWYGVNYVLGQGLHSYGFGAGGVEYVATFALLHFIYVLLVWAFCPRLKA